MRIEGYEMFGLPRFLRSWIIRELASVHGTAWGMTKLCINPDCQRGIIRDALFCPYCDTVQSEQSGIVHVERRQETEPINLQWLDNVQTVRELPALPKGALLEAWRREKAGKR